MSTLIETILKRWPLLALVTSAAMLATAHAFETFGHLAPCTLCLYQRDVYWTAMPVALAAAAAARSRGLSAFAGAGLTLVFAVGVGIAVWHAGAEWKFWPGPSACASTGAHATAGDLKSLLAGAHFEAPHCDVAPWRLMGLSMAGWNALVSLKLTAWSGAWSVWSLKRDR